MIYRPDLISDAQRMPDALKGLEKILQQNGCSLREFHGALNKFIVRKNTTGDDIEPPVFKPPVQTQNMLRPVKDD